jgi:tetratricopeptide (TPR) repeat protein
MPRSLDSRPHPLPLLRRAATGLGTVLLAALAPATLARAQAQAPLPSPTPTAEASRPAPPAEHHEGRHEGDEDKQFKNLQILPKDIPRHELFDIMRFQFARGLGVGCLYCHVGDESKPPSTYDFASDDKATKRKARVMWKMTQAINQTYLPDLPERLDPPVEVHCITCHRGQPEPRQIEDVLRIALDKGGPEAAVARYHELRDKEYGGGSYDFSETALTTLARSLAGEGRIADATAMLELNMKEYPDFWFSYAMLGDMLGETDKARAVENLKKALDLAPEDSKRFLEHRLQEIEQVTPATPQSPSHPPGGKGTPPPMDPR